MSSQRQCLDELVVVPALRADFKPQARHYTKVIGAGETGRLMRRAHQEQSCPVPELTESPARPS